MIYSNLSSCQNTYDSYTCRNYVIYWKGFSELRVTNHNCLNLLVTDLIQFISSQNIYLPLMSLDKKEKKEGETGKKKRKGFRKHRIRVLRPH